MVSVLETHIDSTLDISSTGTLLLAFPMGLRSLYIYTVTWSNNEVCPQTLRLEDRVRGPRGHKITFLSVSSTLPSSPYLPRTLATVEIVRRLHTTSSYAL